MGMDVYSHTGCLVDAAKMTSIIKKKDVKKVSAAIAKFFTKTKADTYWSASEIPFDKFFADLKEFASSDSITLEGLKEKLDQCCLVNGEPSKYGGEDCYVHHADALTALWDVIIGVARPELPDLMEVTVFDSGRMNGWDVPHGTAQFVFNDSDCFELKMTETGKALKKAFGICDKSEWTIVSV